MSFGVGKKTPMLLFSVFVLVFVMIFFNFGLGNYNIGSGVNVRAKTSELIALRTLKCLENNEKLDECIKLKNIIVKVEGEKELFVNKELYEKTAKKFLYTTTYNFGDKYKILVMFRLIE